MFRNFYSKILNRRTFNFGVYTTTCNTDSVSASVQALQDKVRRKSSEGFPSVSFIYWSHCSINTQHTADDQSSLHTTYLHEIYSYKIKFRFYSIQSDFLAVWTALRPLHPHKITSWLSRCYSVSVLPESSTGFCKRVSPTGAWKQISEYNVIKIMQCFCWTTQEERTVFSMTLKSV